VISSRGLGEMPLTQLVNGSAEPGTEERWRRSPHGPPSGGPASVAWQGGAVLQRFSLIQFQSDTPRNLAPSTFLPSNHCQGVVS